MITYEYTNTSTRAPLCASRYLRLHTSLGDLNLELHCDLAPRTCENFLALAEGGYYDGTTFHRSIKNFMAQGGDPTGTGTGGASVFGAKFRDEIDSRLLHTGRGVLAMANSGPNTNGSQFYILYKSARHLDHKHTVFGRVVGGACGAAAAAALLLLLLHSLLSRCVCFFVLCSAPSPASKQCINN